MANLPAIVLGSDKAAQQQITSSDTVLVGGGIDASASGALVLGATTATSITLGKNTFLADNTALVLGNSLAVPDGKLYSDGTDILLRSASTGVDVVASFVHANDHFIVKADGYAAALDVQANPGQFANWTVNQRSLDGVYAYFGTTVSTDLYMGFTSGVSFVQSRNANLYLQAPTAGKTITVACAGTLGLNDSTADGAVTIGNTDNDVTIGATGTNIFSVDRQTSFLTYGTLHPTSTKAKFGGTFAVPEAQLYFDGTSTRLEHLNNAGDLVFDVQDSGAGMVFKCGSLTAASSFLFTNSADTPLLEIYPEDSTPTPPTTFLGQVEVNTNVALAFGQTPQLQIWNDGTDSTIQASNNDLIIDNISATGQTILRTGDVTVGSSVEIRDNNNVTIAAFYGSGAINLPDNRSLSFGTGNDLTIGHNGTDTTATSKTGDLIIDNTNATGSTVMRLGTDTTATSFEVRGNDDTAILTVQGNDTVKITLGDYFEIGDTAIRNDGTDTIVTGDHWRFEASSFDLIDAVSLRIGTGFDFTVAHNGVNTTLTSITGDLIIDNTLVTGSTIMRLGTDTNATSFEVQNNSEAANFAILGSGDLQIGGSSGTAGYVLTSGGAGAAPTWEAAAGGSLDAAYNAGRTITGDAGPIVYNFGTTAGGALDINVTGDANILADTASVIDITYGAGAYTGGASSLKVDWSGMTSLTKSADVDAISLIGKTNAGSGNSTGIRIASFDASIVTDSDVRLKADNAVFSVGEGNDFSITHNGSTTNATGNIVFDDSVTFGSSSADRVNINGYVDTNLTFAYDASSGNIAVETSPVDTHGKAIDIKSGTGGAASAAGAGSGGLASLSGGAGGAGTGAYVGGVGGDIQIGGGAAGADGGAGGARGGNIVIEGGAGSGSEVNGTISIGTILSATDKVLIGGDGGTPVELVGNVTFARSGASTTATAVGEFILDNTLVTGSTIMRLGTTTNATSFEIQSDTPAVLFGFLGSGDLQIGGSSGTSGQVLTSGGADAAPTWESPAASALVYVATTEVGSPTNGMCVYFSDDNEVTKTDSDALVSSRFVGVRTGADTYRVGGEVSVQLVGSLTVVAGNQIFLSATAGLATNVAPSTGYAAEIGIVSDASAYAGSSGETVEMIIQVKPVIARS